MREKYASSSLTLSLIVSNLLDFLATTFVIASNILKQMKVLCGIITP